MSFRDWIADKLRETAEKLEPSPSEPILPEGAIPPEPMIDAPTEPDAPIIAPVEAVPVPEVVAAHEPIPAPLVASVEVSPIPEASVLPPVPVVVPAPQNGVNAYPLAIVIGQEHWVVPNRAWHEQIYSGEMEPVPNPKTAQGSDQTIRALRPRT